MNNIKLIRKLKNSYLVRCRAWVVCPIEKCMHHKPHTVDQEWCLLLSPVKFCRALNGFVHDIPMSEVDSNLQCNPNLAYKAKRDAEGRKFKTTDSPAEAERETIGERIRKVRSYHEKKRGEENR